MLKLFSKNSKKTLGDGCRLETGSVRVPFHAIIFDVDGTLADSNWIWPEVDREYFAAFNIAIPTDLQDAIGGMTIIETAEYFKYQLGFPDPIEKMLDDWNIMARNLYLNKTPLKPGARELLIWCKENGIRTGVASSNSRALVEAFIEGQGISDLLDGIVTGSEVTNGKPAPDLFLAAAERIGADPDKCLAFDDIVQGVQAAKAAGMITYAVLDEWSSWQNEEKCSAADGSIKDFTEIIYEQE